MQRIWQVLFPKPPWVREAEAALAYRLDALRNNWASQSGARRKLQSTGRFNTVQGEPMVYQLAVNAIKLYEE
jgi:hypothetical protein